MNIRIMLFCLSIWGSVFAAEDEIQTIAHLLKAQKYGDAQTYQSAYKQLKQITGHNEQMVSLQSDWFVYYGMLVIKKVPVIIWQLLVLLCWYIFLILLLKKRRFVTTKAVVLGLLLLMFSFPIMIGYYTDKEKGLVTQSTDLYNGPNSALYKIGSINRYELVTIHDNKKQWYKVSHGDTIGWVERDFVIKI